MSRGTRRTKVVDAVLGSLAASSDAADHYVIAETILRKAQPCRVNVGLGFVSASSKRSIEREI